MPLPDLQSMDPLVLVNVLVGFAMLAVGRRLFWVFVAGVGFAVGVFLVHRFAPGHWTTALGIGIAVAIGLVSALVAILLQKLAIGLAGFGAGAYLTFQLISLIEIQPEWARLGAALAGGFIGMLLMIWLFDWAILLLSTLMGASMVAQALPLKPSATIALYFFLVLIGIAIQSRSYYAGRSAKR